MIKLICLSLIYGLMQFAFNDLNSIRAPYNNETFLLKVENKTLNEDWNIILKKYLQKGD